LEHIFNIRLEQFWPLAVLSAAGGVGGEMLLKHDLLFYQILLDLLLSRGVLAFD